MSCSRTQRSDAGEAGTRGPLVSSTLSLSHCAPHVTCVKLAMLILCHVGPCIMFPEVLLAMVSRYSLMGFGLLLLNDRGE